MCSEMKKVTEERNRARAQRGEEEEEEGWEIVFVDLCVLYGMSLSCHPLADGRKQLYPVTAEKCWTLKKKR